MTPAKSEAAHPKTYSRLAMLGFFLIALFILLVGSPLFTTLDTRLRDVWFHLRLKAHSQTESSFAGKLAPFFPALPENKNVIVVLVDDRSVLGIPELFQGNRSIYAEGLRLIGEGKPKAIGLDIFFPSPTPQNDEQDQQLAETVKSLGNVVLKAFRRSDQQMTPPFPLLAKSGFVAPVFFHPQVDESIRQVSLVFRSTRDTIPSFHAEIARLYWGLSKNQLVFNDTSLMFQQPQGEYSIALPDGENALINYNLPLRSPQTISFYDVYKQSISPDLFKDKIVILGIATSMTEERLYTPLGGPEFTPFIHAMIMNNLLSRSLLLPVVPWQGTILAVIILLLTLWVLAPRLQPFWFGAFTTAFSLLLISISIIGLTRFNQPIDISAALLAACATFIFSVGMTYYMERHEKLRIKNAFQHYVTASVVNEILKDPAKLNLHGEERNLSVFFSDIEGFTSLSEGMSPFMVVSLLNEYLTHMTEIIFKYEGLLDKYEGDAIMSVFGAPVDQRDHAIRACKCALEHQKALVMLRKKWKQEGKPEIRVRIGINTGMVVVGNMGSEMRFDYTVIGDNVNLAARLETANKLFLTEILVSGATADLVQGTILTRYLGMLRVRGRKQPASVHEVLCNLTDTEPALLERLKGMKESFEKALTLVHQRQFKEALALLTPHLEKYPDDHPAIFLKKRSEGFLVIPPPPDWDGIIIQD